MRSLVLTALVFAAACGGGVSAAEPPMDAAAAADIDAPPPPPPGAARGIFELTYYWVTAESDFTGTATEPIYDDRCTVLATVPPEFARSLRLEGTGRLVDGRVVNTDGACGCPRSPCFAEVDRDHAWGYGVQDRALVPYRSVAVDRKVVPIGTKLWVAELDGVAMPGDPPWGGFVHDGCVVATDVGGGIDGAQLDWFVGLRSSYRSLDVALTDLAKITVHDGGARCP